MIKYYAFYFLAFRLINAITPLLCYLQTKGIVSSCLFKQGVCFN